MLWLYAVILFFMIMGQAMVVAVAGVFLEYPESIFQSIWKTFDAEAIDNFEQTYRCCSFNGDDAADTWPADAIDMAACSSANDFEPMQTCWVKFRSAIDTTYNLAKIMTMIVLGVQILIYFSTQYVIQSISEAEGVEAVKGKEVEMTGHVQEQRLLGKKEKVGLVCLICCC